ncbi:hypothetical protein NLG97_g7774 [Lecanicillium saksenae]|uniref:Uncharacterized protein n=1 Tax=Lecanicillium saksenae TaxID=468837 RepID=A0ACC1QN68_9HYPO|nr:hypothetical protein NLG97_g7774 [Lecanicillium saksenae]
MRLIHTQSLRLETFYGADSDVPPYAILSHTWGADEPTLAEFADSSQWQHVNKDGYAKIKNCCRLAAQAGLDYVWVDTVCIDKSSSAELTEAINSMFRWYNNAAVCHVWLQDLTPGAELSELGNCRWFSRGWTLQELLAPAKLEFYDRDWTFRGTKQDLQTELGAITKITRDVLQDPERMLALPVAQRMSWAAPRKTTRPEDLAYCLLGIFDVNMPLLYGEGGERAFLRLQEAIANETNDLSLFAWRCPIGDAAQSSEARQAFHGLFAPSPSHFIGSSHLVATRDPALGAEYTITNKGVRLEANLTELIDGRTLLLLNVLSRPTRTEIGVWIRAHGGGLYSRVEQGSFSAVPKGTASSVASRKRIYLIKRISRAYAERLASGHRGAVMLRNKFYRHGMNHGYRQEFPFEVTRIHPPEDWVSERQMIYTHNATEYLVLVWLKLRQQDWRDRGPAEASGEGDGGVAVLAVGKFEYEEAPFAVLMGTELADRVLSQAGKVDKFLLMASRGGNAASVTLSGKKSEADMRLSALLETTVVDNEKAHAVDLLYCKVESKSIFDKRR